MWASSTRAKKGLKGGGEGEEMGIWVAALSQEVSFGRLDGRSARGEIGLGEVERGICAVEVLCCDFSMMGRGSERSLGR